jgi:hypothetical protein
MKTDILESFSEISARLRAQQRMVRKIENIMRFQDWRLVNMHQLRIRVNG